MYDFIGWNTIVGPSTFRIIDFAICGSMVCCLVKSMMGWSVELGICNLGIQDRFRKFECRICHVLKLADLEIRFAMRGLGIKPQSSDGVSGRLALQLRDEFRENKIRSLGRLRFASINCEVQGRRAKKIGSSA